MHGNVALIYWHIVNRTVYEKTMESESRYNNFYSINFINSLENVVCKIPNGLFRPQCAKARLGTKVTLAVIQPRVAIKINMRHICNSRDDNLGQPLITVSYHAVYFTRYLSPWPLFMFITCVHKDISRLYVERPRWQIWRIFLAAQR